MRRGLGDGGDGDGHDGRHRRPGSLGEGEGRQGEDGAVAQFPAGSGQRLSGHLAEEIEAVAADEHQQTRRRAAHRRAEQQRYLAEEALQVAGEEYGGNQRHQSDDPRPVGERAGHARSGGGVGEGVAGQRQADDHRHRAGDGGRQYLFHRAAAAEADDQARGDGHKARKHDAELRLRDQRRGEDARGLKLGDLFRRALRGHHAGDRRQIGEAGAVIEGDLPAGDEDEEQRRQAAGEDGGGHLETGDQRHRHRRREHDDDLLQGVEDQFADWGPLFRQIAESGVVLKLHR